MAVKAPSWFDYATYMTNKLHQLQEADPTFTEFQMRQSFAEHKFEGTDGAYRHFLKYGANEDVSPNEHFDAEYYYKAKAVQYYTTYGGLTEEQVLANIDKYALNIKGAISNAGMNAWTHYIRYGTKEGINPSNDFDTSAYMQAKLQALNDAGGEYTIDDVYAAFAKAGFNALSHYYMYGGKGENEVANAVGADGTIADDFVVPEDERLAFDTSTKHEFTKDMDTLNGTNGNETYTAITGGNADVDTYTAGDKVTDPSTADNDVLNLFVSKAGDRAVSDAVTLTNVEQINVTHLQKGVDFTLNAANITGAKQISTQVGTDSTLSIEDIQSTDTAVGLSGAGNLTATWASSAVSGNEDIVKLSLDSAGQKAKDYFGNASQVDVGSDDEVEGVAVSTSGTNYVLLDGGAATQYKITGTGKNYIQFTSDSKAAMIVDASEAEVGQILDFSVVSRGETVTGSSGDDIIGFGNYLSASDIIDGGEGNDSVYANMASSVGGMSNVERFVVRGTSKAGTFNGEHIADLTELVIENERADMTFKNMNKELATLRLDSAVNQAKTSLSYSLEDKKIVAENVKILVGDDNYNGTTSGQTFGALAIENVLNVGIESYKDADTMATITNTLDGIFSLSAESVSLASTTQANLFTGVLDFDAAKEISILSVEKTSVTTGNINGSDALTDITLKAEDNAQVKVGNGPLQADNLANVTINAGENSVVSMKGDITADKGLSSIDVSLGDLATVDGNTFGKVNAPNSSLDSYTFKAGMLGDDLTLHNVTATGIDTVDISITDQAAHGVSQTLRVGEISTMSLSVGSKGTISEDLTALAGSKGTVGTIDVNGNGMVDVTLKDYTSVETIDAGKFTGQFTLDLSGMQPDTDAATDIVIGSGKATITGATGNIETYGMSAKPHAATAIQNFTGAEDKLDFSGLFNDNVPGIIGGNAVENSLDNLATNTTGDDVSLADTIFFTNDIDSILNFMDGYTLAQGEHAVALEGTNAAGSTVTCYLLTGNDNDTVSTASDWTQIGSVQITGTGMTVDDFVSA